MIERNSLRKDNTSGCTGVTALKNGRWRAEITFRGKRYYLGSYRERSSAIQARREAEERLFGRFLNEYYMDTEEIRNII